VEVVRVVVGVVKSVRVEVVRGVGGVVKNVRVQVVSDVTMGAVRAMSKVSISSMTRPTQAV
jgi:hypothetical protein